jgi:hypothetical protein
MIRAELERLAEGDRIEVRLDDQWQTAVLLDPLRRLVLVGRTEWIAPLADLRQPTPRAA